MYSRIIQQKLINVPQPIYRRLLATNQQGYGLMQSYLVANRHHKNKNTWVFYILDSKGIIVSWALLFPREPYKGYHMYIYTHSKYKKMGFGSRIFNAVAKYTKKQKCTMYISGEYSAPFFNKVRKPYRHIRSSATYATEL